jgi:HSP20 family protein
MRRMHEDMDRMFSQSFGGGLMGGGGAAGAGGSLATWSPAIEVKQEKNNFIVSAELPGLKPDEVHVELDEDALVIQGERKHEQTSEDGGVHRTERRYGHFYRAIPLPEGAHGEQAKAEFRNGVLEVTIPVPEQQSHRRQIPIKS